MDLPGTKKCPLCAEDIEAGVPVCPFCVARFEVTRRGYCPRCHRVVTPVGEGVCPDCGRPVIDESVESRFLGEGLEPLPVPPEPVAVPSAAPAPEGPVPVSAGASEGLPEAAAVRGERPGGGRRWLLWVLVGVVVVAAGAGVLAWWLLRDGGGPAWTASTTHAATPTTQDGEGFPLAGTWSGVATTSGSADMQVTIRIDASCEVGEVCGSFDIPSLPCSGTYTYVGQLGTYMRLGLLDFFSAYEFHAGELSGNCGEEGQGRDFLELSAAGLLKYAATGDWGTTAGILSSEG